MHGGTFFHPLGLRPRRPLVVRGGLARTFGSLAGFLAVSLLCWGIYILADAFADPINAAAVAVISAAFSIAMGAILLFYLIRPGRRLRAEARAHEQERAPDSVVPALPAFLPATGAAPQDNVRNDLPYQRFYIDHSRIRP